MAASTDDTVIFADSILTVTLANGVFRLVLAQQDENNEVREVGKLLVPANQLPTMVQGLAQAMNTLAARGREQAQQAESTTVAGGGDADAGAEEATAKEDSSRSRRKK